MIDQVRHEFLFGCLLQGKNERERKLYDERFLAVSLRRMGFYWGTYGACPGNPTGGSTLR